MRGTIPAPIGALIRAFDRIDEAVQAARSSPLVRALLITVIAEQLACEAARRYGAPRHLAARECFRAAVEIYLMERQGRRRRPALLWLEELLKENQELAQ